MVKRIITFVLVLCMLFSINVFAANKVDNSGKAPQMPQGDFDPSKMPQGEMPQGDFDPSKMPRGEMSKDTQESVETAPANENNETTEETAPATEVANETKGNPQQFGGFPNGFGGFGGTMQSNQEPQKTGFLGFVKTYSTPITSVILLALAFLFVIFYKRKHY